MSKFMKDRPWTLCLRCKHGQVIEDHKGPHAVYCYESFPPIPIKVVVSACNRYEHEGSSTRHEMEMVAWVLEVKKGKVIGFKPPKHEE